MPLAGPLLGKIFGRGLDDDAEGGGRTHWHDALARVSNKYPNFNASQAAHFLADPSKRREFGLSPKHVRQPKARRAKAADGDRRKANPVAAARLRAYNDALREVRAQFPDQSVAEARSYLKNHPELYRQ
jgi:hypothetical protein